MKKFALSSILLALTLLHQVNGQLIHSDQTNNDVLQFNQATGALDDAFLAGSKAYSPLQDNPSTPSHQPNQYVIPDTSTVALGILLSCFLLIQFNRARRLQR